MSEVTARSLRLQCDVGKPDLTLDRRTNQKPCIVRGAAVAFQMGLFLGGAIVSDVSNFDSATLAIRLLSEDGTIGDVQVSKAIAAADIEACSEVNWNAGTAQHAEFFVPSTDLNLTKGTYWLIIVGQTSGGESVVWAAGKIVVLDHGLTDADVDAPEFLPTDGPLVKRGSVDLATDDATAEIEFTTPFASAPRGVFVQIIAPADGFVVSQTVDADPTAEGFTVRFGANIPGAGYALTWLAVL